MMINKMSDVPRDAIELKPATPENTGSPVNNATADLIGGFSQASSAAMSGHEGELQNLKACKTFEPGQKLLATIKAVHKEGVLVEMPQGRGAGVISPRCWGDGEARIRALAGLHPGDEVEVCVRSYHALTRTLSLVLTGCEEMLGIRSSPQASSVSFNALKTHVEPITMGTVLLWDVANLLGIVGSEYATQLLEGLSKNLKAQGLHPVFFIEYRALERACREQTSETDAQTLKKLFNRNDFQVLPDYSREKKWRPEVDSIILQMAEVIPNSICISCDYFRDYAEIHPNLVGTSRVRPFRTNRQDSKLHLSIDGLLEEIVIETEQGVTTL